MNCLTNSQLQAVIDHEAPEAFHRHVAACAGCAERARNRQRITADLVDAIAGHAKIPADQVQRVEAALASARSAGATRLRAGTPVRPSRRRAYWSAAVATAATAIGIVFIAPAVRGPATVSASEILAASASRLAEAPGAGIEILEYELVLDGIPRELMPDQADGTYRVRQLFDHDTRGRYRFTITGPDGRLLSSFAQDPVNGRRTMLVRIDDQAYRFEFTLPANAMLSLPELERLHMQASISMMQASGKQHLQVVETPDGRAYRIEVPRVEAAATTAVWDLAEARALIDADDYRILELSVKGAFLRQQYSISFRLLQRDVVGQGAVAAEEFEVPPSPDALSLEGGGSAVPARDALLAALREVARLRQTR
jgi:hypothetical protein